MVVCEGRGGVTVWLAEFDPAELMLVSRLASRNGRGWRLVPALFAVVSIVLFLWSGVLLFHCDALRRDVVQAARERGQEVPPGPPAGHLMWRGVATIANGAAMVGFLAFTLQRPKS
ncbi:MAG: hypothetical protein GY711_25840 [bacterium]|nr:hypothetical protein [bacterium]